MKQCPYCAEQIQDSAIKCRYCHEFLNKDGIESREKKTQVLEKKTNTKITKTEQTGEQKKVIKPGVDTGFLTLLFIPEGRIGRLEFLFVSFFLIIMYFLLSFFILFLESNNFDNSIFLGLQYIFSNDIISTIFYIFVFMTFLSAFIVVPIKRFHDFGYSGLTWIYIILIEGFVTSFIKWGELSISIPYEHYLSLVFIINISLLIALFFTKGDINENKYGEFNSIINKEYFYGALGTLVFIVFILFSLFLENQVHINGYLLVSILFIGIFVGGFVEDTIKKKFYMRG